MDRLFKLTEEVNTLVDKNERFRATRNSIKNHIETDSKYDELVLDFEIIGLPQYRLTAVRNVEPITIYISEDGTMPIVKVRDDFPVVPHLNIHNDNTTKSLCYSDLRYEEIKHKMSGRFLLTCIENWFLNTSMNKLHRTDQPIEPFFTYVNDVIIWDINHTSAHFERFVTEKREFGKLMYRQSNGDYYAMLHFPVPQDYSNLIHNMPQTLFDLFNSFNNATIIKTWLGNICAITSNPVLYNQYFQQSRNKLLSCKVIINVVIPKSRMIDEIPETYELRTFVTEMSLKDILVDYGLVLQGSKITISAKPGSNGENIVIHPFNVHHKNLRMLNKRLNSIDTERGNEQIALIGVGALGSHILNNSLRAGYGKWAIIDNDYLWPHNIARHVLTSKDIGYAKVKALADLSTLIQSDAEVMAITEDIFSGNETTNNILRKSDVIIDASASVAVERYLALDIESKARRLSCFLNPEGTATIMLLESSDRKSRLDLLEMQYYHELVSNAKFSTHMVLPDTMVYSGSCRSITSLMSQDNVSLSAVLCSKALKTYLSDDKGKIIIWTHKDDSVCKDILIANKWETHKLDDWTIEISESLLETIKNDRATFMPKETGGVLIGTFDLARKLVYIVSQIEAPNDSIRSPTSFIRGCANLPQRLECIKKTTFGNLSYIGEWHSHTNTTTQKSADDEKLHNAIVDYNRENCLPGCMMIVGTNSYNIFIDE